MINVDIQKLVQALDAPSRRDLEAAAQSCVRRGAGKVLPEDLLLALLERPDSLLLKALEDAEQDIDGLRSALQPRGEGDGGRSPSFALELVQWLQDALLVATLELGRSQVDSALLLGLLHNRCAMRHPTSRPSTASAATGSLTMLWPCRNRRPALRPPVETAPGPLHPQPAAQARDGRLDPVLCRDQVLRQMIDILARRRKNNPIVIGDAGVGKTAVVEGLALRIVAGEVPEALRDVDLLALDMGLLQAGASIKGEFERRLQAVIDEVRSAARPVILFIDEAHTLIGAGGQPGTSDAANLLKPALARGELRTIAATTWSEYKKHFEKDPALTRRFQPVQVLEPTTDEAVTILRAGPLYEAGHGVYLRDDAVIAAAQLSARYLAGRQLPDKAVDVLDTACARVRIGLALTAGEYHRPAHPNRRAGTSAPGPAARSAGRTGGGQRARPSAAGD